MIEEHAVPEFEAEQVPEAVGVIELSGGMFVDELSHSLGAEQSSTEAAFGEQDIAEERLE